MSGNMMEGYPCCALGVTRSEMPCFCTSGRELQAEFNAVCKISYAEAKTWLEARVEAARVERTRSDREVAQAKVAKAEQAWANVWAPRYALGYVECVRCGGTGRFGHWGECYRCRGAQVDPKRRAKKSKKEGAK